MQALSLGRRSLGGKTDSFQFLAWKFHEAEGLAGTVILGLQSVRLLLEMEHTHPSAAPVPLAAPQSLPAAAVHGSLCLSH